MTGSSRRLIRTAALLCAGGTALLLAQPLPAIATPLPGNATALRLSQHDHLPYSEAFGDIGRQDQLAAVAQQLLIEHPDSYAGAYFDYSHGPALHVGFVGTVPRLTGIDPSVAQFVVPHSVPRSQNTLRAFQEQLDRLLSAHDSSWQSYLDIPFDRVTLELPPGQTTGSVPGLSGLIQSLPQGAVEVRGNVNPPVLNASTCDAWSCPPPMRGGVEIDTDSTTPGYYERCSTGFMATGDPSQGPDVVLSAGHCAVGSSTNNWTSPGPDDVEQAGPSVGYTVTYQNSGDVDGMSINIDELQGGYAYDNQPWVYDRAYTGSSADTYPYTYTIPSDPQFTITGTASSGMYVSGMYLCKSGVRTGTTCGDLNQTGASITACEQGGSPCFNYTNMFGVNLCTLPGDSGGAIYSTNSADTGGLAYGLDSNGTNASSCSASSETYSSTIPNITAVLGVKITTGTAPAQRGGVYV